MVSHGGVHLLALLDASSLPGCILNTLRLAFHAIQEADTTGIHRSRNICQNETYCDFLGAKKHCLGLNITCSSDEATFLSQAKLDSLSRVAGHLRRCEFTSTPRQMLSHSGKSCPAT